MPVSRFVLTVVVGLKFYHRGPRLSKYSSGFSGVRRRFELSRFFLVFYLVLAHNLTYAGYNCMLAEEKRLEIQHEVRHKS